jgi:hypothetical protein
MLFDEIEIRMKLAIARKWCIKLVKIVMLK